MKRNLNLAILLLFVVGCATVDPNADPVVVNAERVASMSADTIDTFLHWEYQNRATLPDEIKAVAQATRLNAPKAILSLRALTKAYKRNRTAENKATLITAQAVVSELAAEAQKWLALNAKQ